MKTSIKEAMIYRTALMDVLKESNIISAFFIIRIIRKLNERLNDDIVYLAEKDKLSNSLFTGDKK